MEKRYRKGDRVESLRWPGTHGTVVRRGRDWLGVRWDGARFTESEAYLSEVKPSTRPAPRDQGPGYAVLRRR
jgi:hypothetical protein